MAANSVQIKMTAADGRPLAELQRLISERVRLIKGETTDSAVAATAINVLKSVRSATRRADPKKTRPGFTIAQRNDLVAGFKGREKRRVIRQRGGHELTGVRVVNRAGAYQPGETVNVYIAIVRYGKATTNRAEAATIAFDRYYIMARSEEVAVAYMSGVLRRKIEAFAGMAKWVVGQAMRQVSAAMNASGASGTDAVKAIAQRVGLKNLKVRCVKDGVNSGTASVYVLDGLDYAVDALRGGKGALNTIYMKAANKTASIINHWVNHMGGAIFSEGTIEAPFPEAKTRR